MWEKGMVGCVFTIIHLLVFFASLPHCGWATPHKSNKLNMPANLENSAVATGLEKVSFHFNPKERERQRTFR